MKPFEQESARGQVRRLEAMAREALRAYAVSPARLVLLRHENNTTFRVETAAGETYVLRLTRPGNHSVRSVRSEMSWLEALSRDTDLSVPTPLGATNGDLVTLVEVAEVPEPRICVLLRWQEGRFLDAGLRPVHLQRVGELAARLQSHGATWQSPRDFARSRVDLLTREARQDVLYAPSDLRPGAVVFPIPEDAERAAALTATLRSPEDGALVAEVIRRVGVVLTELGSGPEHFGLIHADLHQENYCFQRGSVHAIDFDDCGWGHHLYDLSVTLIELEHLPNYPELRGALLAGYRRLRPLSLAHEGMLDAFFALRRLQLLMWVLESREHPAFADWQEWSQDLLAGLSAFVV